MTDLSIIYDKNGPVPQTVESLRAELVARATALAPGLTTELPGSLIEDMASTGTGALISVDQMRVDLINSVGPLSANLTMLTLLAQQYGVQFQKIAGSTTVNVTFTGTPNFLIQRGFIVSDGTYQYATNKPVTIRNCGTSPVVTATATTTGAWAVPVGTVANLVTSVPNTIALSVNNLTAGVAANSAETNAQFRARVWNVGMSTVQGEPDFIRAALNEVENIDSRQVSVVQTPNGWVVMCGGGDTIDMATAIFKSAGDITRLQGSTLNVTGISNANPGVISTDLTHGFSSGEIIRVTGATGISGINNVPLTITVINEHDFSIGIDTTASGSWVSGGVITPNLRNVVVQINNWPDTYNIRFVEPLQQLVTVNFQWRSQSVNYLSDAVLLSLSQGAVITYINSIYAGQPLNLNKLQDVWLSAINDTIDMSLITTLDIVVTVNGVLTQPDATTDIISGDPYSYFYIATNGVTVTGI